MGMNRSCILSILLFLIFSFVTVPHDTIAAGTHVYEKPEDVVAWIYRDFAFEAIMPLYWKDAYLIDQPRETLQLYFTDDLAFLILKDRQCVEKTHEICNLDFDPIFASQDPGGMDLEISPADKSNTVHVQFMYPGNGQKISLSYEVENTLRGWRIKDIIYESGGSLRKILSQKL
jgi:hypothetical protein